MLEYPEFHTIMTQMKEALIGKTVIEGTLIKQNSNLFMEKGENLKYALLKGGTVTDVEHCPPEIFIRLDNGYCILFCQCGGKINYHGDSAGAPGNCTIRFDFQDGSCLTYTMQLWSLGIYALPWGEWESRKRTNSGRQFQPLGDGAFEDYFAFIGRNSEQKDLPVKIFLSKFVAGVMSTCAAEILLHAKIHPSVQLKILGAEEHRRVYQSMREVLTRACEKGGKTAEADLYGRKGGYAAMTERKNIGKACPVCGSTLEKNSTGGVTAFCPVCQVKNR